MQPTPILGIGGANIYSFSHLIEYCHRKSKFCLHRSVGSVEALFRSQFLTKTVSFGLSSTGLFSVQRFLAETGLFQAENGLFQAETACFGPSF